MRLISTDKKLIRRIINKNCNMEINSLLDSRYNEALQGNNEYLELENKLIDVLNNIDREKALLIDDIVSRQQLLIEDLLYKQGLRDALSIF